MSPSMEYQNINIYTNLTDHISQAHIQIRNKQRLKNDEDLMYENKKDRYLEYHT